MTLLVRNNSDIMDRLQEADVACSAPVRCLVVPSGSHTSARMDFAGVRTSRVPYTDSLNSDHYCKRDGRVSRYR